jgi:hypothetical protein
MASALLSKVSQSRVLSRTENLSKKSRSAVGNWEVPRTTNKRLTWIGRACKAEEDRNQPRKTTGLQLGLEGSVSPHEITALLLFTSSSSATTAISNRGCPWRLRFHTSRTGRAHYRCIRHARTLRARTKDNVLHIQSACRPYCLDPCLRSCQCSSFRVQIMH